MNPMNYRQKGIFLGIRLSGNYIEEYSLGAGIFTLKLADGWTDGMDDRHIDGQTHTVALYTS